MNPCVVTAATGSKALTTGDGRPLPPHLKTQIRRELDRLELLLEQIKAVEAERDVSGSDAGVPEASRSAPCCWA